MGQHDLAHDGHVERAEERNVQALRKRDGERAGKSLRQTARQSGRDLGVSVTSENQPCGERACARYETTIGGIIIVRAVGRILSCGEGVGVGARWPC